MAVSHDDNASCVSGLIPQYSLSCFVAWQTLCSKDERTPCERRFNFSQLYGATLTCCCFPGTYRCAASTLPSSTSTRKAWCSTGRHVQYTRTDWCWRNTSSTTWLWCWGKMATQQALHWYFNDVTKNTCGTRFCPLPVSWSLVTAPCSSRSSPSMTEAPWALPLC